MSAPIPPLETIRFANGIQVTLNEEGRLEVLSYANGIQAITIHPRTDNSCHIAPVGTIRTRKTS